MSKQKRTIWDEIAEIGQEVLRHLDDLFMPEDKRRKPARVPIPVRSDNPPPRRNYDE